MKVVEYVHAVDTVDTDVNNPRFVRGRDLSCDDSSALIARLRRVTSAAYIYLPRWYDQQLRCKELVLIFAYCL